MGLERSRRPEVAEALAVTAVPAFADNYIWLIHGHGAAAAGVAVVDPGDAAPVLRALSATGLTLEAILATHHHADHIGGVEELLRHFPVPVFGPAGERIPGRTVALAEGADVALPGLGLRFTVFDIPGHTAGHIAYYGHGALFCGDTLFSGGCGRLFEGTPAQMLNSLDALSRLPPETRIYCGHEYTAANLRFAQTVEPENAQLRTYAAEVAGRRARSTPTLPSTVGLENLVNPFLRSRLPGVRAAIAGYASHEPASDAEAFGELREWKNGFRG
jgi:hydroxyacylglutathione hydrolase